jgi:ankyrin repeat protein
MDDLDDLLEDIEDLPVAAVIAEAVVDDDADNANILGAVGAVRGIRMHHFHVIEGEDGGDAHVLVRLRGGDVESLNSHLCDLIRESCTCFSVLPGWSPRTTGCQRIVERCRDHPEEAFYASVHGRTPLHEACLRGSCRHVIKALLQANPCGVMDRDLHGNTPLHLLFVDFSTHGIMNPQELDEIVGDLLNASINFSFLPSSTPNIEGYTALHIACSAPETMVDPNSLKRLLAASPECAAKLNSRNQTALRIHCERRNASPQVAQLLLDAHPDALLVLDGEEGWAPLHYAASTKNLELIRFLVDYNPQAARVRTAPHNHSPLHLLCRNGLSLCHLPAVDALRNADPDSILQRDAPNSYTPLHLVCRSPRIPLEIVKRMLATNPKVAASADADDYLPLHHACETGCEPDIVKHLLEVYPAGAHALTRKQDTALSLACTSNKHVQTIKILIQANTVALIKRNDYGFAPLHCVCRAYQPRMGIVEALLNACPSCVTLKTHAGETPVHLACSNAGAFVGILQLLTVAQKKSVTSNAGELQNTVVPSDKRMTNKVGNTPRKYCCMEARGVLQFTVY